MGELFKSVKWSMLLMGVLTTVVGFAILFNPKTTASTIISIVGVLLIIAGVISIIGYAIDKKRGVKSYGDVIIGVIIFALGLILALRPETLVNFIGYIFAIILVLHGLNDLLQAFACRGYDDKKWTRTLLLGLLCIVLGIIIFVNPFATINPLMILIGVAMVIDGISDILIATKVGYVASKYKKEQTAAEMAAQAVDVEYTEE